MTPREESARRRITIPKDVWQSAEYYAHDEQKRIEDPVARAAVTAEAMIIESAKMQFVKMGHYPPRVPRVGAYDRGDGEAGGREGAV